MHLAIRCCSLVRLTVVMGHTLYFVEKMCTKISHQEEHAEFIWIAYCIYLCSGHSPFAEQRRYMLIGVFNSGNLVLRSF